jgi:putative phosphoesterase
MLQELAPVEAVQGNMDTAEIRSTFPPKKELQIEGFTIGVTHGSGAPQGIIERIRSLFTDVDAIVFGHSHHPFNERRDGILFFNPGSPTDRFFAPYNSLGILELRDEIRGQIIRL